MKDITSEPLVLSGEYGTIYGKPLLVCTYLSELKYSITKKNRRLIFEQIIELLEKKNIPFKKNLYDQKKVDLKSPNETRHNIGQIVVEIVSILTILLEKKPSSELTLSIAKKITKKNNLDPYGVLTAAAVYGGLTYFRKEFDFLPYTTLLPFKFSEEFENNLHLIHVPVQNYRNNNEILKLRFAKKPKVTRLLLDELERSTKQMTLAIAREDEIFFKNSIIDTQNIHKKLGVVSKEMLEAISYLARYGAAKITGENTNTILLYANHKNLKSLLSMNRFSVIKPKLIYKGATK